MTDRSVFRYPELLNDELDDEPVGIEQPHGPRTEEQLRFANHLHELGIAATTRYEAGDALYVETFADQATVDAAVRGFLES
jgi:hypothetical protein